VSGVWQLGGRAADVELPGQDHQEELRSDSPSIAAVREGGSYARARSIPIGYKQRFYSQCPGGREPLVAGIPLAYRVNW
jgi:hypothetical protein